MATSLAIRFECPAHFSFAAKVKALMLSDRSLMDAFRCDHIFEDTIVANKNHKAFPALLSSAVASLVIMDALVVLGEVAVEESLGDAIDVYYSTQAVWRSIQYKVYVLM